MKYKIYCFITRIRDIDYVPQFIVDIIDDIRYSKFFDLTR